MLAMQPRSVLRSPVFESGMSEPREGFVRMLGVLATDIVVVNLLRYISVP